MQIGIFGGSFNPVHFGHTGLAAWIAQQGLVDEVWMMVSPNNPIKPASMLANEEERYRAVAEAVSGIAGVRASRFEFDLPRPSYTYRTLQALTDAYPEHEFSLIIGEDNLRILHRWREWQQIVHRYRILVYPRHATGGEPEQMSAELMAELEHAKGVVLLEDAPYFDISSTAIRAQEQQNCK